MPLQPILPMAMCLRHAVKEDMADVIYSEYGVQGTQVIAKRCDKEETPINLEMLFNAVVGGKL